MIQDPQSVALKPAMQACADAVEATLDQLLQLPAGEQGLEQRVMDAMRYSVLGGGKRLRPFLVLQSSALFNVPAAQALRVAAAIECVHCYSLIHDDLPAMDNDDMRRGKPTVHKVYDEATAILAGDALLTLAFEILGDLATHPSGDVRSHLVVSLAQASGSAGMVGGQMIDLAADAQAEKLDLGAIRRLQAMKTGALILFSAKAGALLGGADSQSIAALHAYAIDLGIAFQMADDLLDVVGDSALMGKAAGKDADAGKATFVSLLGAEAARREAAELSNSAIDHLHIFDSKADHLRALAKFVISRKS